MKRIAVLFITISLLLVTLITGISSVPIAAADFDSQESLRIFLNKKFAEITAPSYIVYDYDYQQVLTGKNEHEKRPVASLVKMMTSYITYEYVTLGKVKLTDMVTTSQKAADTVGSTAFILPGDQFTLSSALYAIIISSSNDVTVAVAEHVAGTEAEFVNIMNAHAASLGMENTKFADSTGINDSGYTTAHDMAILSNVMLSKHPEYITISRINYDRETFRNSGGAFHMYNTNKFLRFVPESEGMKIGSTLASMYCISATYKDANTGRRLIVVMLGCTDENTLYAETRRAFEYCLANYFYTEIEKSGKIVTEIAVIKGVEYIVECEISGDFYRVMTTDDKKRIVVETVLPEEIEAPCTKGDVVGKVVYKLDDEVIYELDIVLSADVERASWFQIFIRWLAEWFGFT